jgi:hypothetical protein
MSSIVNVPHRVLGVRGSQLQYEPVLHLQLITRSVAIRRDQDVQVRGHASAIERRPRSAVREHRDRGAPQVTTA